MTQQNEQQRNRMLSLLREGERRMLVQLAGLLRTSVDEIKRLYGDSISNEVLQGWRTQMEKAFTDVKSGDQLIGVHLPKIGCRFYSRDKLLAEIRDTAFADAFFGIWFDPRSNLFRRRFHRRNNPRLQLIHAPSLRANNVQP